MARSYKEEGCIGSFYVFSLERSKHPSTTIAKFSNLVGLPILAKPKYTKSNVMPKWIKNVYGIRSVRLLREIIPFLEGDKQREAEKALTFFDANGYYRGLVRPAEIWSASEFPLRSRKPPPS